MELIADTLLVAGALGAGFYCYILARRLARFNDLETGVGGAVAVLSAQVDDLTRTLDAAQGAAGASTSTLEDLTDRAEGVAKRLELLVASMHDLPEPTPQPEPKVNMATQDPAAPDPQAAPPDDRIPAGPIFKRHTDPAAGAA